MPQATDLPLRLRAAPPRDGAALHAPLRRIDWVDALRGSVLGEERERLAGRCVLVAVSAQVDAALAMLELDGLASRLVVVPPDFRDDRLNSAIRACGVDAIVCDPGGVDAGTGIVQVQLLAPLADVCAREPIATQWVMPTSGTTGQPKFVAHSPEGLAGAISARPDMTTVWGTFYDIRRFGGLQIFLRAVIGGAPLVLCDPDEALIGYLSRMGEAGVTHVSGTPSHWRRVLMSGESSRISPRYIRLSGEIADRAILESLASAFPEAKIVHAYASTEAGVGFEVADGREGFPARYLEDLPGVEMRVVEGSLRIRSARTASHYVGRDDLQLKDEAGFVDTDDLVEAIGDRCFFRGRRAGTINVGGLKVHPEEVEQVINLHEAIRMSRVRARTSPITGGLIVAEVVLMARDEGNEETLRKEIIAHCRARLERHKVPVAVNFVQTLPMSSAGKLLRGSA